MSDRKMHRWNIQLQSATGEMVAEEVQAFWDPEHETTDEAVRHAAMTQAWLRSGKRTDRAMDSFAPISVESVA
jgi:hypothetical protein